MASYRLQVRLCEPTLLSRIDAAAARERLPRPEWARRQLRAAVEQSEAAQQKAEAAADYAAALARGEGAPL
jgi:hypothetical protein